MNERKYGFQENGAKDQGFYNTINFLDKAYVWVDSVFMDYRRNMIIFLIRSWQ